MKIIKPSPKLTSRIAAFLKKGGVVICPTDTVYGFLADALNKKAVDKIYNIKKRPKLKPLPVFVKNFAMAQELAFIDQKQAKRLKKYWPGKYTFILKLKSQNEKRKTTSKKLKLYGLKEKTVAMRIPNHKFLSQLLKKLNRPLVQTSVNISGRSPVNNIEKIINQFGKDKRIALIIDGGRLKMGRPSKIIDLTSGKLTRLR